jgi:hypothetical protein
MLMECNKTAQPATISLQIAVLIVLLLGVGGVTGRAGDVPKVYCTGTVLEADRCASAWLIKRFVDKNAAFIFLSDEELMNTTAIPFDTATATLRRSHRLSTFEVIRDYYSISGSRVDAIAKLIHDIEINFWNKKSEAKLLQFQQDIDKLLTESGNNQEVLTSCFHYLDVFEP